ncbi:MAG TPA: hypothetical protein VIY48_13410 [Candidatus Paceibacterota bacterium]
MDLDDILGGKKSAPSPKFDKVGTKVVGQITEEPKAMPVYDFVKGKRGDQLYFQGKKLVRQSDLNMQLPFDPVPQVVIPITTKDGIEYTLWMEGEKLKALKQAIRESGVSLALGVLIAVEFFEEEDTGAPFPKKHYRVQLKAAPGE